MISSKFSLLKYNNPILVSRSADRKSPTARVSKRLAVSPSGSHSGSSSPTKSSRSLSDTKLPPIDDRALRETQEILDVILPPREWSQNGETWVQHVSSIPATRTDVIALQEQMDTKLMQRQARETGICPVRRELYSQCFDELIRHVAINCAERGLLLLRVRDEISMTIAAYQTLYESSIAFGMRKALQSEKGRADMEKQIRELEKEKRDLENQVEELKAKYEQSERMAVEQREMMERKHAEELQFFRKTNQQLKAQLEGIIAAKI